MTGRGWYRVLVLKGGLVYDQQAHDAEGFSLSTYIRDMLANGYGLDITFIEYQEDRT